MEGRSVFDAVRTIADILEFAEITNTHGILVAIDFEKAFASLNHNFLFKALEKFNFAPHFIQWITTSHADIFQGGYKQRLFSRHRGVHQGDSLSCLLLTKRNKTKCICW